VARQKRATEGGTPWCVQVELAEGCTRLCTFCGLNAIRSRAGNFKYMSMETAELAAKQTSELNPRCRIEFALRGEPLANPNCTRIIKKFREYLPGVQLMLTTNGDTLKRRMQIKLEELFHAGLNLVILDTYYPEPGRQELRDEAFALHDMEVLDFFTEMAPYGISPWHNKGMTRQRMVVVMDDLLECDGETKSRVVKNHAGSNPTMPVVSGRFPLVRNCARPFREIVIHYDGSVPICCDDWRRQFTLGNIFESHLGDIWRSELLEAARARLYNKDRAFGPCKECDVASASRSGLLAPYDPPTLHQIDITEAETERGEHKIPIWKGGDPSLYYRP